MKIKVQAGLLTCGPTNLRIGSFAVLFLSPNLLTCGCCLITCGFSPEKKPFLQFHFLVLFGNTSSMLLELALFFEVSSKEIIFCSIWLVFSICPQNQSKSLLAGLRILTELWVFFSIFIVLRRRGAGYFTFMI